MSEKQVTDTKAEIPGKLQTAATGRAGTVTASQVSEYLRNNPDFFVNRDELLADITLPHESGKAISLLERQVKVLRDRSIESRHTLNKLIENARYNDQLFSVTRNLILTLLKEKEIADIAKVTEVNLCTQPGIDACCVVLFESFSDQECGTARIESRNNLQSQFPEIFQSPRTHCLNINKNNAAFLFPHQNSQIRSVALCPIGKNPGIGILVIGNQSRDYFNSDLDTLFLDFIGEVLNSLFQRNTG